MQDLYAFDTGDFGKLGLLRVLMRHALGARLGIIWYATQLGARGGDGKHTTYLDTKLAKPSSRRAREYRACDPVLYDTFRNHLVGSGSRSIAALEKLGLLPSTTRFVSDHVPASLEPRKSWFEKARSKVADCDLVFCDPDNGLATSTTEESSPSRRHMLWSEIQELRSKGHTLVLYHHLNREKGGHVVQTQRRLDALLRGASSPAWGVQYRRGSGRVFFVLPQPQHVATVEAAIYELAQSEWVKQEHMLVHETAASASAAAGSSHAATDRLL
jgi:hypothetical protein